MNGSKPDPGKVIGKPACSMPSVHSIGAVPICVQNQASSMLSLRQSHETLDRLPSFDIFIIDHTHEL